MTCKPMGIGKKIYCTFIGIFFCLTSMLISPLKTISQERQITITATQQFSIEHNLCSSISNCWYDVKVSPSGEKLFIYFGDSGQLFTLDQNAQLFQYDLSSLSATGSVQFDFVPYSEDAILFYNGFDSSLYTYDLTTQTTAEYLSGRRFLSCNSDTTLPIKSFVRPFQSDWLVVCGIGSSTTDNRNISVINLATNSIYEIGTMSDDNPRDRQLPWRRVFVGYDGTVYAIIDGDTFLSIFPEYEDDADVLPVVKRGIQDTEWTRIDIPLSQLAEFPDPTYLGSLAGVDAVGNLYFYRFFREVDDLELQFLKVNPQGQIMWMLPIEVFGTNPRFVDIAANGNLIFLDGTRNSTLGAEIVQYEVSCLPDSPLSTPSSLKIETNVMTNVSPFALFLC